uniref:Uncharacterized protein n=1 Tax=Globisporangium ultimum (strain ATCC 200006 / CBS 805.95 / DAOM BR144) TaxID=431595 RepID=K3WFQ2_GLOUD
MAPFSSTSPSGSVSTLNGTRFGRNRSNSIYSGNSPAAATNNSAMLADSTKKNVTSATAIRQHLYVINWDNVLMPTAWLSAQLRVDTSMASLQNAQRVLAQTPQLRTLLAAIEERIIQLIKQASALGQVCILSEKTVQVVELTCSIFFPRLTTSLRNAPPSRIFVVGIADTNYSQREQVDWKVNILRTVCYERVFAGQDAVKAMTGPKTGRFGVVTLCSGDLDVHASDQLKVVAPYVVTKSVKVGGQAAAPLSLEAFAAQLETLAKFVREATAFNGAIRIAL